MGTLAGATVGGIVSSGTNTITLTNTSNGTNPITIGAAGSTFYTSGTNSNWSINPNPLEPILTMNPDKTVLEVKGKMVLNGLDLEERLNTIEKVLMIPERDVIVEQKHPKLKKLYDEYIAALGKYRTFDTIKGNNE